MAKGKSDISNSAIRMFLQKVGEAYDQYRGLQPFKLTTTQWAEVLDFFDSKCCYCDESVLPKSAVKDHLIPINKDSLGLHSSTVLIIPQESLYPKLFISVLPKLVIAVFALALRLVEASSLTAKVTSL